MDNAEINFRHFITKIFTGKDVPTLTEDERVILSNLHYEKGGYEYERIGRTRKDSEGYSDLYLIEKDLTVTNFNEYLHLFQFIQERRRIPYRRTIERRIKMLKEIIKQIIVNIVSIVIGVFIAYGFYLWLGFEITILIYLVSILGAINSKKS